MKENITDSAKMMGLPADTDMNSIFGNMIKMLDVMRKQIDSSD